MSAPRGRPSRRGVDRNSAHHGDVAGDAGRPSRRGVDRNVEGGLAYGGNKPVAPRAGAWIETTAATPMRSMSSGRPSRRGVDRNRMNVVHKDGVVVSPLAQGRGSKLEHIRDRADDGGSPLAQGRGSKPGNRIRHEDPRRSPLAQG